jgi:hypothetical protein
MWVWADAIKSGEQEIGFGAFYSQVILTWRAMMAERAFVVMQVGAKESAERRRADEIYRFIIAPAVSDAGLEPYRADLDFSPGAITPKMLSELLSARVVIADLTGRNPNVFYELGITHSFARPLISIADSSSSLPFDAKDERIIELGEYPASGLLFAQGQQATCRDGSNPRNPRRHHQEASAKKCSFTIHDGGYLGASGSYRA